MALDANRKIVLLTSLVLGTSTLIITPVYSIFINQSTCKLSSFSCVSGVKFIGGEATYSVPGSLVLIPLLLLRGGRKAILIALALSIFSLPSTWWGMGFPPFIRTLSLARTPECYIFGGDCLDHNLYHLSHIPFYVIMSIFSYRAYVSQKPKT